MGGETDQWYPDLVYDNHPVNPPGTPEDGYHLSKDIADKTIEFIRDAKVIAPDKPWFSYVCPGAGHAPHHVFKEWADKYAGRFDMGYERYREIVLEKQKSMGIVPPDTELSPINPYLDVKGPQGEPWPLQDTVRPWDSLNDEEKRLFSRMAEVFAGFLSYTDAQIGRILDYLEESGQLDNTIIVVISDNGASGEGGPNGSVNEGKFFNGYIDTVEESMKVFDHLGGPETYNHYPIGWAMAFNTPYKLYKRYASHEGGIADTAIISWPNGIAAHGEVRDNYVNVCDITPTVYDLLGMTPPDTVKGIPQKPLDGVSFKAALDRSERRHRQADPVLHHAGHPRDLARGLVRQHRARRHARPAGRISTPTAGSCYHIEADRSQCHDLAAEQPDKLEELKALWFSEAAKYNGLPLADLNIMETLTRSRPYLVGERTSYIYYPDCADVGIGAAAEIRGRSFARAGRRDRGYHRRRRCAVQAGRRARRARAVHPGRSTALRLQLPRRAPAAGFVIGRGAVGQTPVRRPLLADGNGAEQPHAAWRCHLVHRRRRGRHARRRDSPTRGHSGWRARASPSGATAAREFPAATRRRSLSPAAPSPRSPSTFPAGPTRTWKRNSRLLFRATERSARRCCSRWCGGPMAFGLQRFAVATDDGGDACAATAGPTAGARARRGDRAGEIRIEGTAYRRRRRDSAGRRCLRPLAGRGWDVNVRRVHDAEDSRTPKPRQRGHHVAQGQGAADLRPRNLPGPYRPAAVGAVGGHSDGVGQDVVLAAVHHVVRRDAVRHCPAA